MIMSKRCTFQSKYKLVGLGRLIDTKEIYA